MFTLPGSVAVKSTSAATKGAYDPPDAGDQAAEVAMLQAKLDEWLAKKQAAVTEGKAEIERLRYEVTSAEADVIEIRMARDSDDVEQMRSAVEGLEAHGTLDF